MHLLKLVFFILLAQVWGVTGFAQTAESLIINFRTLALSAGIDLELYFNSGSDFKQLSASHYRPSSVEKAKLNEDQNLSLYKKIQNEDGVVEFVFEKQIKIPAESEQVLLIIAETSGRVGVFAASDNLSKDHREWLFVNTTRTQLAFQLGDGSNPISLPPGDSVRYLVDVEAGRGAAIRIAAYKEKGWDRVYSTYWPIYEDQRSLVICLQDGERIRVRNFFESVLPPGE